MAASIAPSIVVNATVTGIQSGRGWRVDDLTTDGLALLAVPVILLLVIAVIAWKTRNDKRSRSEKGAER